MAVVLLKDLLGTMYVTEDYTAKLNKVLETTKDVIDLARCKFSPGAHRILMKHYKTVEFCNSIDPELDKILKHNCNVGKVEYPKERVVPLVAKFESPEEVLALLKSLSPEKLYTFPDPATNMFKTAALAILITMVNPKISLDLRGCTNEVFNQIRLDWLKTPQPHNRYYAISGAGIIMCEKDSEGMFQYPGHPKMTEEMFIKTFTVIPSDFGTKQLSGVPEYQEVWDSCVRILYNNNVKGKLMKDFIEVNE